MNFAERQIHFSLLALAVAVSAGTRNHFSFSRIYVSTHGPGEKWYSLSSQLVGRQVSEFVKRKFFQLFRSEICRVQVGNLWWENHDHVPKFWFSERTKNVDEPYGITLFGLCGGLIKQSSSECHGFLYLDVFKRVMEAVNNVDIGEFSAASLPGVTGSCSNAKIAENQSFELERELVFYRGKLEFSWGKIIAVRFNFMISGYHDSWKMISL